MIVPITFQVLDGFLKSFCLAMMESFGWRGFRDKLYKGK
ncbi:hypothetical protein LEP1GSC016_0573 [Leptospira borgpetersenii serovar Hardjo-bovis str. Sponselee]|uniref:Uncharacterized protein n=2 Tax=Leptospira borgpetersenii TaxID=174 RepID=M6C040_LEPBO|nr:hypothetical protein LEP1GSC016_0573 [Leptospira borgpetersenii serovar Hardjo-bovis str. Sponselee]EMO62057.1 hypothetical protein LEP1GSC133_2481 [Leptospira borgpetersenii serovar Pomona str. 200901868]